MEQIETSLTSADRPDWGACVTAFNHLKQLTGWEVGARGKFLGCWFCLLVGWVGVFVLLVFVCEFVLFCLVVC